MSLPRRSFAKPSIREDDFEQTKAAMDAYGSIDHQVRCLKELYNRLYSSSSDQRNPKVLHLLRELKATLRKDYSDQLIFSPNIKVVVVFDDKKNLFFNLLNQPFSGYPRGFLFMIDDSVGTIAGLSKAIYKKVLKAFQEEGEEERRSIGEGYNNNNNNNNSHAAEDWQEPVNIKQEVVEDDEVLIDLIDEVDEERYSDELQQEENYNSQAISPPPAFDNNDLSEDSLSSANFASSSSAIVPPAENGSPAVNPQATDTDADANNSISNNTAEQERRQTSVSSSSSTVNRRQSEEVPIKLEPAGTSSTVTITRRGRPSKWALRMAHEEAPAAAAAAASVAVSPPPAAASNFRILQVNL